MTLILALETSTTTCGIALLSEHGGVVCVRTRELEGIAGHATSVLPLSQELLAEAGFTKADLSAVAFGQGPGAFTGIRVACGVAQGIGMALGIPLIAVGALHAVAAKAAAFHTGRLIIAALDARMDEVYLAAWLSDAEAGLIAVQPPVLLSAADVPTFVLQREKLWLRGACPTEAPCLTGEGWRLPQAMAGVPGDWLPDDLAARPQAYWVAQLAWRAYQAGQTVLPEQAAPLYLRDKVAFTTAERATGQGGNPRARHPEGCALLPMTYADLHEVFELETQVQSFPWSRQNFEDALKAGYEAWVLRSESGLLGFCLAMLAPDVMHILVIAVSPAQQRQGLGRLLLDQCLQTARQQQLEGLILEVRPSNLVALAFYQTEGFTQIGVRRDYYPTGKGQREDALILKKTFEPA
jgi:tRNA threonylcarbamoyladenosine biosynthesis protein TsaB